MAVNLAKHAFVTGRQIRVFISSTFRDMNSEREELIKRVFPLLRKKCENRGVIWGDVDLRWGITEEQKSRRQGVADLPCRNTTLPSLLHRHSRRSLWMGAGRNSGRASETVSVAPATQRTIRDGARNPAWRPERSRHGRPRLLLFLTGPSGIGKSALIAKWVSRYRENAGTQKTSFLHKLKAKLHSEEEAIPVILHLFGASAYSANRIGIVRRLIGEFNRQFEIKQPIPDDHHQLRKAFADALNAVAEKGRIILIIDGLNQLEDRDQAPDLVWLPERIPSQIRLILSTLSGRSLVELKRRAWPILEVFPLSQEERLELIQQCLAQYSKTLSSAFTDRLVRAEQTANPLPSRAAGRTATLW